jgi:hypothetical protein
MESLIRKLQTERLQAQLESLHLECDAIAKQFDVARTSEERADLAQRWDKAVEQSHATQLMIDLLVRRERELKEHQHS